MRRFLLFACFFLCATLSRAQQAPFPGQPGGVNGQGQCNTLGVMGGCPDIFDLGSVVTVQNALTVSGDTQFAGPNPAADVRGFGKFATFSNTTATTHGNTTVNLASAQNFKNGEYVTLFNAGAPCGLSTPGTPTVTPSVNSGGITTVTAGSGASSFAYEIVAADKFGCYTPASASGSTSAGNALGVQTFTITTLSRANNVATANTSATHNFVVGELVHIKYFTTSDISFEGFWIVNTVPTGTSFTFLQGQDTRNGASTSATGGTVIGFNANAVTWTAVSNAWKYYVYGRTGGTFALLGVTLTNSWVDYGSPMNDNQQFPAFIPTTAPSVGANDHLTAKITAGGGTTSLTLASAAGTSASGVTILSDDGPALIAAANSANAVYIPSGGITINSYTQVPSVRKFQLAGNINANDTIENVGGGQTWESVAAGSGNTFSWGSYRQIVGNVAYPQMVLATDVRTNKFAFVCAASNGCLNTFDSLNAVNISFDYTDFVTGNGSTVDYLGQNSIFSGGGFSFYFNKCLWNTGTPGPNDNTNIGNSPIPSVSYLPRPSDNNPTNDLYVQSSWFLARGAINVENAQTGIGQVRFKDIQTQSSALPFIQFTHNPSGPGIAGGLSVDGFTGADRATAGIANYQTANFQGVWLKNITASTGSHGTLTGLPFTAIVESHVANSGQNTGYVYLEGGNGAGPSLGTDGVITSLAEVNYPMVTATTAPTAVLNAGGSLTVGTTYQYTVQFLDVNGFYGAQTAFSTAVTPTTGNQSITVTRPAAPTGAVAWQVFSSIGGLGNSAASIPCSTIAVSSTTFVDSTGIRCGLGPQPPEAGATSIGAAGVSTPSLVLWNGGFTSTFDFPNTLTANRNVHVPDSSGTIAFTDLAQTWTANQTLNHSSQLRFLSTNGTNYAGFQGGASTSNLIWLFPTTDSTGTQCLSSNGSLQLSWSNCSGGTGTPGGANTQVQYNASGSFGGSADLTWGVGGLIQLTIGRNNSATSAPGLNIANSSPSGASVTVQNPSATSAYNFNLPTGAGTTGQPLQSGGGGSSAMTFGTLGFVGGGTNQTTFTANQLVTDISGSLASLAGTLTGTNPVLTLTAGSASAVPLTLNTASTPTGDIFDLQVNGVKTSWFDSAAFLHVPQTTYTGTGSLSLSANEATPCPVTPQAGVDILCIGNSATHTIQSSLNGQSYKDNTQWNNSGPTAHGVAIVGITFPQITSTSAGTVGQPLCSNGASTDPAFCNLTVGGGGTGDTTLTAHAVLLGEGTSAVSSVGPSATANLPLINQVGADPIYGALPLSDTTTSGTLPIDRGGTGAASFSAAGILTPTGSITVGHCAQWSASTVLQDSGGTCGGAGGNPPLHTITAATASNTINSTINPQIWNWALTGSTTAFRFGENTAATGASNVLLQAETLSGSTAIPFKVDNNGNGWQVSSAGQLQPVGTGNQAAPGTNGQLLFNNSGVIAAEDPVVSFAFVNIWTAQDVTTTRTSSAVRNPIFSQTGTLQLTWASITGSPATCTLQIQGVDSQGNALNNGSTFSVSPANGTTSQTFTAAAALQTAAQIKAIFACVTYPSTGTLTLDFTPIPNVNVTNSVSTTPPANASTNLTQVGGSAVVTGTGASGSGIPRVTISNDSSLAANQSTNVNQFGGNAVVTGTGAGGNGIPRVTISNDSSLAANQSVNVAQVGGTATDTNSGNKSAGTQRFVLATDQPTMTNAQPVTPQINAGAAAGDTTHRQYVLQYPDTTTTSYHASASFAGSSTTDNSVFPGNATNTALLNRIVVTCTQTTAGVVTLTLIKRSAADTSGTSATMTKVPDDSNYAAAVSAPLTYTGTGPSVGAAVGNLDVAQLGCNAAGTAGPNDIYIFRPMKPIILRGTAQQVAVNLGNAAITGGTLTVTWEWEESTTP